MVEAPALEAFLDGARVDDAVHSLRPDYRAVLLAVDGLEGGPGDDASEALLRRAESSAQQALREYPVDQPRNRGLARRLPSLRGQTATHPQQRGGPDPPRRERAAPREPAHRHLQRRVGAAPAAGGWRGPGAISRRPELIRASGDESFATVTDGAPVTEHPDPGEVVWCDDAGVTCRRWNWRQALRTQLGEHTTTALFILEALAPMTDEQVTTLQMT